MRKIYKYPLKIEDRQIIEIPRESKILSVGIQSTTEGWTNAASYIIENLVMWVLVDVNDNIIGKDTTIRIIHIIGTGNPIPEVQLKFIGTSQMKDGFVWHIFEEI